MDAVDTEEGGVKVCVRVCVRHSESTMVLCALEQTVIQGTLINFLLLPA